MDVWGPKAFHLYFLGMAFVEGETKKLGPWISD